MALLFEQQEKETPKAFAAWSVYLGMGEERSLKAVARKLGKNVTVLERWSRKYDWPARIVAYNGHLARIERETAEAISRTKGIDWARRHEEQRQMEWERRTALVSLADEMIERWRKAPHKYGTLEGIARLLDLASKLGRLASGMPTEVKEVTGEVDVHLDVEWEVALRKVYGDRDCGPGTVDCGLGEKAEVGGQRSEVGRREERVIEAEVVEEGR